MPHTKYQDVDDDAIAAPFPDAYKPACMEKVTPDALIDSNHKTHHVDVETPESPSQHTAGYDITTPRAKHDDNVGSDITTPRAKHDDGVIRKHGSTRNNQVKLTTVLDNPSPRIPPVKLDEQMLRT